MPTIRLAITPQTNVRSTQGMNILFRIPEECPVHCGLPRKSNKQPMVEVEVKKVRKDGTIAITKKTVRYGCPHMLSEDSLNKKRRLEKYNNYKADLLALAKQAGYQLERSGTAIYFFLPIPLKWNNTQRKAAHGQFHDRTPDLNNLVKAFEDALLPYADKVIGHYAGQGKYWVDTKYTDEHGKRRTGPGWIEIQTNLPVYDPFGVINKQSNELGKILAEMVNVSMEVKPPRNFPTQLPEPVTVKPKRTKTSIHLGLPKYEIGGIQVEKPTDSNPHFSAENVPMEQSPFFDQSLTSMTLKYDENGKDKYPDAASKSNDGKLTVDAKDAEYFSNLSGAAPEAYDGKKSDKLTHDEIAFNLFKDADIVEIVPDKMSASDFQQHFKGRARNNKRKH